jgi:hypothetical protein
MTRAATGRETRRRGARGGRAWAVALIAMALSLVAWPSPAADQTGALQGTPDDLPEVAFDEGGCARGAPGPPSWAVNLATLQLIV